MQTRSKRSRVVIVGGGASGALTLIKCLRQFGTEVDVALIEPREKLGLGLAYSPENESLVLNVPVEKMSIELDNPRDFQNWLEVSHPEAPALKTWPFVPRAWFGQYLKSKIDFVQDRFTHIQARVANFQLADTGKWHLKLNTGEVMESDFLVIATGYAAQASPRKPHTAFGENSEPSSVPRNEAIQRLLRPSGAGDTEQLHERVLDGFDSNALAEVDAHESVLIVGAGLTSVDVYRQLMPQHRGPIRMLSRHGLLPIAHLDHSAPASAFSHSPAPTTLHSVAKSKVERSHPSTKSVTRLPRLNGLSPLTILQVVRAMQRASGAAWPVFADQIRLEAQAIWSCWSQAERAQFLRHVRPHWEIIRHRLPNMIRQDLETAVDRGVLEVVAGRIAETRSIASGLRVSYCPRGETKFQEITCERIILATGAKVEQDLVETQEQNGLYKCESGFGYNNQSAPNLWLIGPASKSLLWETTAMREIVIQSTNAVDDISKVITRSANPLSRVTFHPHSIGATYWTHLKLSASFSAQFLRLALVSLIHAVLPFVHTDTASNDVRDFAHRISRHRIRRDRRSNLPPTGLKASAATFNADEKNPAAARKVA